MKRAGLLLAAALAAGAGSAPAGELSLAGSGLFTLPSTATMEPGHFRLGLAVDNRDRDPLGIDVFDLDAVWTLGVTARSEFYGRHVISRVVSMPEDPPLPPPPLDLVVPPGARAPARPYWAAYWPSPYVNHRGTADLDAWVPGDLTLGFKLRVGEAAGRVPALAVALEATAPLTEQARDLTSGAGTGGVDLTGRVVAEWVLGRWRLLTHAAYTHAGDPALSDRVIEARADGVLVREERLDAPDRVELDAGARRALGGHWAVLAELGASFEAGPRTPALDRAWPLDLLAGAQWKGGPARLTLALRYHGHALPSGERRAAPLAGLVDLSRVDAAARERYLQSVGAGAAAALLDGTRQVVVAGEPGAALPDEARVIARDYGIRSEHQVGFVLAWGFSF